jgi:hypothetical protein
VKEPTPDNVSNAFLLHRLREEMAAFLREARAEGGEKGLTPKQMNEIILEVLDEMKGEDRDS